MLFQAIYEQDGTVAGIALASPGWDFDAEWEKHLIETADPSFLRREGDSLIVTTTRDVATYTITGETPCFLKTTLAKVEPRPC